MVDKVAKGKQRSPRRDREQEAIVSLKDDMNERMSSILGRMTELRKLLKQVKSGWNGGPAPDIGMGEKVNLTDPLPDMVAATGQASLQQMVELTKELNTIIQELRQVDSMQDNYAAARTQRVTERAKQMQQIEQQAAVREEFIKIASNPLTRVWAHIVAPFSSEKGKRKRLGYLRALARIDRNLKLVQDHVLSGDPAILNAIETANELYLDAETSFFEDFRRNLSEMSTAGIAEINNLKINSEVPEGEKGSLTTNVQMPGTSGGTDPKGENASKKTPTPSAGFSQTSKPIVPKVPPLVPKVQMPIGVPTATPGPTVDPGSKVPIEKPPAETITEQPPTVPEQVPPSTPVVQPTSPVVEQPTQPPDHDDKASVSLKTFMFENYTELKDSVLENWSNVNDLYAEDELPEIWKDILLDKFTNIRKSYAFLTSLGNLIGTDKGVSIDRLYKAYVYAIQCLIEFLVYYNQFLIEQKAAEVKGSFTFGSTIDDDKIQEAIKNTLDPYIRNINTFMKIANFSQDGIIAYGGNGITRWFNRMKTHLSSKRDANVRLYADRSITRAREGLQKLMDNLEQRNINFRSLIQQSEAFYNAMIDLYDKLNKLGMMYNSRMRIEKSNLRVKKDRMPYDFIPVSDVNQMRNIKNALERDKEKINTLKQIEDTVIAYQEKIQANMKNTDILEGLDD